MNVRMIVGKAFFKRSAAGIGLLDKSIFEVLIDVYLRLCAGFERVCIIGFVIYGERFFDIALDSGPVGVVRGRDLLRYVGITVVAVQILILGVISAQILFERLVSVSLMLAESSNWFSFVSSTVKKRSISF